MLICVNYHYIRESFEAKYPSIFGIQPDAGGILGQVRPEIDPQDGPHDLGNKTIIASLAAIKRMVIGYDKGQIVPVMADMSEGKLCLRRHLTVQSIVKLYSSFEQGLIKEYKQSESTRNNNYPIILID